ncbi:MAG TPA: hypothetical protein PLA68_04530 [Panacibacter sp.]|nr:hypothetical protein [Panacibacter sp.]
MIKRIFIVVVLYQVTQLPALIQTAIVLLTAIAETYSAVQGCDATGNNSSNADRLKNCI